MTDLSSQKLLGDVSERFRMSFRLPLWFSKNVPQRTISSKYVKDLKPVKATTFVNYQNMDGAFLRPNGIFLHSRCTKSYISLEMFLRGLPDGIRT